MTITTAETAPSATAARVRVLAEHQWTHWDRETLTWRCSGTAGKPCGESVQPQSGEATPLDIPPVAYKHAAHQVELLDALLDDAAVARIAEAMALEGEEDGCFQECRAYEALEEWARLDFDQAHGYPSNEYEQRDYWLRKAAAVIAVMRGTP